MLTNKNKKRTKRRNISAFVRFVTNIMECDLILLQEQT